MFTTINHPYQWKLNNNLYLNTGVNQTWYSRIPRPAVANRWIDYTTSRLDCFLQTYQLLLTITEAHTTHFIIAKELMLGAMVFYLYFISVGEYWKVYSFNILRACGIATTISTVVRWLTPAVGMDHIQWCSRDKDIYQPYIMLTIRA